MSLTEDLATLSAYMCVKYDIERRIKDILDRFGHDTLIQIAKEHGKIAFCKVIRLTYPDMSLTQAFRMFDEYVKMEIRKESQ